MATLEEQIKASAEKAVLNYITNGGWIQPDYSGRIQIPRDMMLEVWGMVDVGKLKLALVARLEAELADRIINSIAAELATDIKQILSVTERREEIRQIARTHMKSIMAKGPQTV